MSGLKIMCPICTDNFEEADEIYSTSCGHMYHLSCMRQWQCRATSCPQCRSHNPTSHKIFLILNDEETTISASAPPAAAEDQDLQVKLQSSVDKISELYAQVQEAELNFYHLQEQFTAEQQLRKQFELRFAQSNENENNFLQLHAQYSESEDRVKLLQEENECLAIENEYKAKELDIKASELLKLKESLNTINFEKSVNSDTRFSHLSTQYSECEHRLLVLQQENRRLTIENDYKSKQLTLNAGEIIALKELRNGKGNQASDLVVKVKTLEKTLQQIADELQKEISNSTQLAIDKIKLKGYIQRIELQINETVSRPKIQAARNKPIISKALLNFPTQHNKQIYQNTNKIILLKFPYKEIHYPLEEVIVSLAAKMDISITKTDVSKATMMDRNALRNVPKSVAIYVEFKNENLKTEFLSKKNLLKKDETYRSVNIKEYTDQKMHAIYVYANKKLRGVVFDHISCINNTVMGKNRNETEGLIIYSKEQVDQLVNNKLSTVLSSNAEEDGIDECYYTI